MSAAPIRALWMPDRQAHRADAYRGSVFFWRDKDHVAKLCACCPCGCGAFVWIDMAMDGAADQPPAPYTWNGSPTEPTVTPPLRLDCGWAGSLTDGYWIEAAP